MSRIATAAALSLIVAGCEQASDVQTLFAGLTGASDTTSEGAAEPPVEPASAPTEAAAAEPAAPATAEFPHHDPGDLVAGSGEGVADATLWSPGMRFPLEQASAFLNSQVYGVGGSNGPAGSGQCDTRNYSYPWRDNFCESRSRSNGFCPSTKGHQGQDIRPATCEKKKHWVVAPEAGEITEFGSYTVYLKGDSGILYRFMHMDMAGAKALNAVGARVERGARLGQVSNDFGGTPTTIHLHFEMKAPVETESGVSVAFVPPYASLVDAYGRLKAEQPAN